MRSSCLTIILICSFLSSAGAQESKPSLKNPETPFWSAPKIELAFRPATVQLVSVPDPMRPFALLQIGDRDPKKFKVLNPNSIPFLKDPDSTYNLVPKGLKVDAHPYVDRKQKITKLDNALLGLPFLQTKMDDKPILDSRFAIVLYSAKPCYVLVALDERVLDTYKENGVPGWLQEYAPTGHKLQTDDPIMAQTEASYLVFARRTGPGRITLGPPCMDQNLNAMYFAFFAEAN